MASPKKNRALLIVNYDFYRSQGKLTARPGAVKEADRLFKALSSCNYAVQLHYDLTAEEIHRLYEKGARIFTLDRCFEYERARPKGRNPGFSPRKNRECDADHGDYFVSILSSHGEEGVIFDCEGQPVDLTQIFDTLSLPRSHKLAGKPKIIFIQACRGEEIDPGVWVETDSGEPHTDCFTHYLSIPEDTAVMFACSPGYAAFINRWESVFLKALLEILEGENRHLELTRLMTWINWRVAFHFEAKGKHSGGKEMPCFVTNMVKEVYPFSSQRKLSSRQ